MPAELPHGPSHGQDPAWVRLPLIALVFLVIGVLVVLPVLSVFAQALVRGPGVYLDLVRDRETLHAIWLSAQVVTATVVLNTAFGIAAAWLVARFRFPGRTLLVTLIDLPFSVSPVVAGLVFVLLFGQQGWFGPWLRGLGVEVIYNTPGLILATAFVTLPFVARELLPVMEALGSEEEAAAVSLGASGWQLFWRITLPNIRWALLFGVILCGARALGEYGAVAVVSGKVGGQTETVPLRVERLFQDDLPASFALASLLTVVAVVTLLLKVWLERLTRREVEEARAGETGE
jgi:sulfate transport system permease protein